MNSLKQFFYNLYYVNVGWLRRITFLSFSHKKMLSDGRREGMKGKEKINCIRENAGGDLRHYDVNTEEYATISGIKIYKKNRIKLRVEGDDLLKALSQS